MIVLVFTGGTISMRHDEQSGVVPALSGREILALAPGLELVAPFEVDDWGHHPGPHMSPERVWGLREHIMKYLSRADVDGVVVVHGTDSLEETAYLLARSVSPDKPVVVTGAMRSSSDLGWDGPANLAGSMRVAASPGAVGRETMVVMNDRIYSGLDVAKTHTHAPDAFESPGLGPIGVLDDGAVIFLRTRVAPNVVLTPERLATPVDIVAAYAGADSRLVDASRVEGRGLVVMAMGRGNVPPEMVGGIERWIADGKPVVISSRAQRGSVGPTYGYPGGARRLQAAGAILAGSRRPQQARLDLMLALGCSMSTDDLRALFATTTERA